MSLSWKRYKTSVTFVTRDSVGKVTVLCMSLQMAVRTQVVHLVKINQEKLSLNVKVANLLLPKEGAEADDDQANSVTLIKVTKEERGR